MKYIKGLLRYLHYWHVLLTGHKFQFHGYKQPSEVGWKGYIGNIEGTKVVAFVTLEDKKVFVW